MQQRRFQPMSSLACGESVASVLQHLLAYTEVRVGEYLASLWEIEEHICTKSLGLEGDGIMTV